MKNNILKIQQPPGCWPDSYACAGYRTATVTILSLHKTSLKKRTKIEKLFDIFSTYGWADVVSCSLGLSFTAEIAFSVHRTIQK